MSRLIPLTIFLLGFDTCCGAGVLNVWCDDHLEELYINGEKIQDKFLHHSEEWKEPDVAFFTSKKDRLGADEILVKCENKDTPYRGFGGVAGVVTYHHPTEPDIVFPSPTTTRDRVTIQMKSASSSTWSTPFTYQHKTLGKQVVWGPTITAPGPYVFKITIRSGLGYGQCTSNVQVGGFRGVGLLPYIDLKVTESSTSGPYTYQGVTRSGAPESILDGNTNQYFYEGTCLHTGEETQPYVRIDTLKPRHFHSIRIYGRMDGCCTCRNRKLKLWTSWNGKFEDAKLVQDNVDAAVSGGALVELSTKHASGQYLFISRDFQSGDCRSSTKGYLDFCGVKIYECGASSANLGDQLLDAMLRLW